jgi:anti-sigma regulatory factor (Ser/Thr protein kinase)
MMEASFRRDLEELPSIFTMAASFCSEHALADEERTVMSFILEELFTNVIKYGRSSGPEIRVRLGVESDRLILSLTDCDADRFDLRELPDADVGATLDERTPGGLGIHLVRQFADRIDYQYSGRESTITILRRLH